MNLAINHPGAFRARSAALAIFATFTALFLAYVDLFLLVDDRSFKTVSRDFWSIFNFTYIAFFIVVVAVLITALSLTLIIARSGTSGIPNASVLASTVGVVTLISIIAWGLFFTVHGFTISV